MAAPASKRLLRELRGSSRGNSGNLELLLRRAIPFAPNASSSSVTSHQSDDHRPPPPLNRFTATRGGPSSSEQTFPPAVAAALGPASSAPQQHRLLGRNLLLVGAPGTGRISRAGWDSVPGPSVAAFSRVAPPPKTSSTIVKESSKIAPQKSEEKKSTEEKTSTSRIKDLFSALEQVPLAPLGLGLAGAIPFVGLTPGIALLLPLPDTLSAMHIEAQAAYGAVILTFLGGPHWGLAMAGVDWSQGSKLSKRTIKNVRYIWSIVPSLLAWPAMLLSPVPKLAVLATSFVVVLGVDAAFARSGLLPSWYMPLRYLLTGIATLSLTSSLVVTAAGSVIHH